MQPVIGIPQPGHDLFRQYMKSKYAASLRRADTRIQWIELDNLDTAIAKLLACDGMLLTGGGDIDPHLYGQKPSEQCGKPNALRDEYEWKMLEAFLPTGKPILGICRGIQLMNVVTGGTLIQDIQHSCKCKHSDFRTKNRGTHMVLLQPNTKLEQILGTQQILVNSLHHQVADRPGKGMVISAISEDGFIEGIELANHPFCIGVQWHPEHMSRTNATQQGLFNAFVAACKK